MKHRLVTTILVVALTALASLDSLASLAGGEPDTIIFPHDLHFENDVECAACHAGAADSARPADHLLPDMDVCADCHDIEDESGCAVCHTNVDEAGDYERHVYAAGRFGHAPHIAQGLACESCHGAPVLARPTLPGKTECRACHTTAADYTDCRLCHLPEQDLLPADHRVGWRTGHGACARSNEGSCYECHTENTCQECHAGDNVRPRSHDLNYAYNHALDARGQETECATCHQEPTYCSSCHISERVLPLSHSRAGWVNTSGGQHAVEGQFDLEGCIACHDTGAVEPMCATCHGGN